MISDSVALAPIPVPKGTSIVKIKKLAGASKRCTKCNRTKSLNDFHYKFDHLYSHYRYNSHCKKCIHKHKTGAGECTIISIKSRIKSTYSDALYRGYMPLLASPEYIYQYHPFKNQCQCCKKKLTWSEARMDHCHKTGKFIAWLCDRCNRIEGLLNNEEYLDNMLSFLQYRKSITSSEETKKSPAI